jgi:hypothetical protein
MKTQTAVEWLEEQCPRIKTFVAYSILEQAKEMEKQQIIDACDYGIKLYINDPITSEDYYEEVYGNKDDLSDWDVTLNDGLPD